MAIATPHPARLPGDIVRVLDVDPDLGARLDPGEREKATARLLARQRRVPEGPWEIPPHAQAAGTLGLLMVEGIAAGTTEVHGRRHTELVGPGDVTQPWTQIGDEAVLVSSLRWRVHSPMTFLVLDRRFAVAAAPWPEIAAALMNRLVLRARRLSFQMAASSLPRTTERLLLMLWHFADRWGKVTGEGVLLQLPITHTAFASVVGTRRPSLTTAIGELRDAGLLATRGRGDWVLRPPAPAGYEELRQQVGLPVSSTA